MLPLRELQLSFANAVFDGTGVALGAWIHGGDLDPDARINIYRNNLREAFLKALSLEFPVIQRLVGEDYFRQLARQLLVRHPSRAGNLHHVGKPFGEFLRAQFENTPYSYLPDVAELEWAYQESLIAPDVAPLDLTPLQALAPEKLADLRFELHPACKLVRSEFPILRIWLANRDDSTSTELIDLRSGPDFLLLHRVAGTAELRRLPKADFSFLRSISRGGTLGESLQVALCVEPEFDPGQALRQFVSLGVLTTIHLT